MFLTTLVMCMMYYSLAIIVLPFRVSYDIAFF